MNAIKDYKLPVNVITGFLGSGKTTAIKQLLAQKPEDERWAVIVNEFGEVGIDSLAIEKTGELELLPLSGGCVCCRLGPQLHTSLKRLLEMQQFDRLIIEPTGMGHPAGILDTLLKPYYREHIDLRAIICLVDPRELSDEFLLKDPTFIDQINMSDILVANKSDLASDDEMAHFYQQMQDVYPPKQQLLVTHQGQFDVQLLDLIRQGQYVAHTPNAHVHHHVDSTKSDQTHSHDHQPHASSVPEPCIPVRYTSEGMGLISCGWIFHPEDIFDFDAIETLLAGLSGITRLKAVFRIGAAYVFVNRVKDEMDYDAISYRRDSRIEILAQQPMDWNSIEAELIDIAKRGVDSPFRDI